MIPFKRILVTGADGFVGRELVPLLAARLAPDARLFLTTYRSRRGKWEGHRQIPFDLQDPASVTAAIAESLPDLVIHLAGQASISQAAKSVATTWSVNLGGSLSLARAMADLVPGCAMLYTSSVEVYGLTFNDEVVTEQSRTQPQSAYAHSKVLSEEMLAAVLPTDAQLMVVRSCNHTGPDQDQVYAIPSFAAQIARAERSGSSIIRVGNLDAARDFLDVHDVALAYLDLLSHAERLPRRSILNLASGQPVKMGSILDRLRGMSFCTTEIEPDPLRMRPSDVASAAIDTTAIRSIMPSWKPIVSLDEMLARVLAAQRDAIAAADRSPMSQLV